jgi:hypothetical protein
MCPIQYQSLLVLLDPPDRIFQSKVEKQWGLQDYIAIYLFRLKTFGGTVRKQILQHAYFLESETTHTSKRKYILLLIGQ